MKAVNDKGEVLELVGGRWVPVPAGAGGARAAPAAGPRPSAIDNPLQGLMVGAGSVFNDIGINARDLMAALRGDLEGQYRAAGERSDANEMRARMAEDAPISTAIGSVLPGLATLPIGGGITLGARGALAAPILAGRVGQVATQVGIGAGLGAATSTSGELGQDAGIGGALSGAGVLAGQMVSRVRGGMRAAAISRAADDVAGELGIAGGAGGGAAGGTTRMTQAYAENLAAGKRVGMQTTLGMETGARSLQQFEAGAAINPVWGRPFVEVGEQNRQQAVKLALRAMGEEAGDSISDSALARVADRISTWADSIGDKVGKVETTGLRDQLQKIATAHAKEALPDPGVPRIMARFESGAEARAINAAGERVAGDVLTGRQLMTMRSTALDEMQSAYRNGKPGVGQVFAEMVDTIDKEMAAAVGRQAGAMEGKAASAFLDDYRRFRDTYKVFAAVEGGRNKVGEIQPGRIAAALTRRDKTGFALGGISGTGNAGQNPVGDFYDAIRFMNGVGQDALPMNGSRIAAGDLLRGEGLRTRVMANVIGSPLARLYMQADPRVAAYWLEAMNAAKAAQASNVSGVAGAAAGRGIAGVFGG